MTRADLGWRRYRWGARGHALPAWRGLHPGRSQRRCDAQRTAREWPHRRRSRSCGSRACCTSGKLAHQIAPDAAPIRSASRGKVMRAEPIAALYEQHRVHHVGAFPALEDQQCGFAADFGLPLTSIVPVPGFHPIESTRWFGH